MAWAVGFTAVTVVGLAGVSAGILLLQGLLFGVAEVFFPASAGPPTGGDTVRRAFVLAAGCAVVVTAGVARLNEATVVRRWPPVLQGLLAAAVGAPVSLVVLLLGLGIDPVDALVPW